ncbi:MAG: potassium channel family protein [Betaproteobacteria bacterium]
MVLLIVLWASGLIVGFATIQTSLSGPVHDHWLSALYFSGTNFFTLGYGDIVAKSGVAKGFAVIEAGIGFGFLAVVIGYLPVLYQLFSDREKQVIELDARAGTPPIGANLVCRHIEGQAIEALDVLLRDWEHWAAQLNESHLSYPMLSYYRSQQENQSWLMGLAAVMDACALVMIGIKNVPTFQARMTFATSRLALVQLCRVFQIEPAAVAQPRLTADTFTAVVTRLAECEATFAESGTSERLAEFTSTYEPFFSALSAYPLLPLPQWLGSVDDLDNWQDSARGVTARHCRKMRG